MRINNYCKYYFVLLLIFILIGCRPQPTSPSIVPTTEGLPIKKDSGTPTASITPTNHPITTALPKISQTPNVLFVPTEERLTAPYSGAPFEAPFILTYTFGGEVFLQNIETGAIREMDQAIKISPEDGFLGWTNNSCGFYIRQENYDVVEVDLRGNITRKVYTNKIPNLEIHDFISPTVRLSPNEHYAAFIVGDGSRSESNYREGEYHYDMENIYVIDLTKTGKPLLISKQGGAWNYKWSPDSSKLAFLDYDHSNVFQVFISNPDGKNTQQISNFLTNDDLPTEFLWSHDGMFLAVLFEGHLPGTALIFSMTNSQFIEIQNIRNLWWGNEGLLSVIIDHELLWVDPIDGHVLKSVELPESIGVPTTFDQSQKTACLHDCFGHQGFGLVVFDAETKSIKNYPNVSPIPDDFILNWIPSEPSFPGETKCRNND